MPPSSASASGSLQTFARVLTALARIYLRPVGLLPLAAWETGAAVPLAGSRFSFAMAELIVRDAGRIQRRIAPLPEIMAWGWERGAEAAAQLDQALAHLTRRREPFAGLSLDRPRLMGIVNVTPDSFSDGGRFHDPQAAIAHGCALAAAGVEILDVGGESTRPGAAPVSPEEEMARVIPVITALAAEGHAVSVDTRHAATMRAALKAGAVLVNDVTALTGDPESLDVVARSSAAVVLMHMQGEPRTMQAAPDYPHGDAPLAVFDALAGRVEACLEAGIPRERIAIDPGIGFGKTDSHNIALLEHLALFHGLGTAVLLGASRKSFIGRLSGGEPAEARLPGSLTAALSALERGVSLLRVHDGAEMAQARAIWWAIHAGVWGSEIS